MNEGAQGKVKVEVTFSGEEYAYVTEQTELFDFSSVSDFIIALMMLYMSERGSVPLTK